jgi:hypothetical protein
MVSNMPHSLPDRVKIYVKQSRKGLSMKLTTILPLPLSQIKRTEPSPRRRDKYFRPLPTTFSSRRGRCPRAATVSARQRAFEPLVSLRPHCKRGENALQQRQRPSGAQGHNYGVQRHLIKDLGSSSQECERAFDELSAQNVFIGVDTPAGRLTRMKALLYIITHASSDQPKPLSSAERNRGGRL